MSKIRICENHDEPVPLVWTFAFTGKEYWCPYCGYTCGMLGAGKKVDCTPILQERLYTDTKRSREYLRAKLCFIGTKVRHNGVWIDTSDLPDEVKEENRRIIDRWVYPVDSAVSEGDR